MKTPWLFLAALLAFPTFTHAETVKDREGAIREDKAKMDQQERWVYNDIEAGFAKARETGRPLMVVLRCVPCMACMGIDTQVLMEADDLSPLMDQFVTVRVINANALDMSLFQFDYDLSFSTLFFNGDGTIYGRFGSWEHQKDSELQTLTSYKQAMEAALKLHAGYPGNKAALAGKQGKPIAYEKPVEMPALKDRFDLELEWNSPQLVKSCVHCHHIGDSIRESYRDKRQAIPDQWIYPFPAPETVGLTFSNDDYRKIEAIEKGSPADGLGLQPGDQVVALDGQPLISVADVSWALHNAPDAGSIPVEVARDDRTATVTLPLPAGWRRESYIGRRVGSWPMRAMAFGGMKLEELTPEQREERGIAADVMALEALHVGKFNKHGAARKEGFREGDLLIEVDGDRTAKSESKLIGDLIREHKPGEKVPAKVLRGGKTVELKIPVQ